MRIARTSTVLALIVASIAPASSVATDQPTGSPVVHVSGVVRPGMPLIRIDPSSSWLLVQRSAPGMTPGRLVNPLIDPLAPWRIDTSVRDVWRWRGGRFEGALDLADPRFIGWLSMLWNTDVHRLSESSVAVHAVAVRLEAGGGSWVGTLSGTGDPATGSFRIGGSLEGTGAFAGGTAILDVQTIDEGWRVDGLVVTGALPPFEAFVR